MTSKEHDHACTHRHRQFGSQRRSRSLPTPSDAQTVSTAEASANGSHEETSGASAGDTASRLFRVKVPQEALDDLRRRLAATRWPDQVTVTDRSQGVQLATMRELVRYWQTDHDWRKAEAKLNALPLIITHGWHGSVFELINIVRPLTDPTAYGRSPEDAFDLVIPSMPGYGFSGRPQITGWNPDHIARAWAELSFR